LLVQPEIKWWYVIITAASLQCNASANTPAAWNWLHWLHPVLDNSDLKNIKWQSSRYTVYKFDEV